MAVREVIVIVTLGRRERVVIDSMRSIMERIMDSVGERVAEVWVVGELVIV
jgi:hypothetical protein